jgi:hypothetical protein
VYQKRSDARQSRASVASSRLDSAFTVAQARGALVAMLTMTRSIEHLTVEGLARTYRLKAKEIEYLLTIERQRRARTA